MSINNFIRYAQAGQQRLIMDILRQLHRILNSFWFHLWTIFDLASVETFCRIRHEIPQLYHSVSEYVSTHFRGKVIFVDETCCRRSDEFFRYFRSAIQQVHVYGMDINILNCVATNFQRLTKITFEDQLTGDPNVPCERADILADVSQTVQTLIFNLRRTVFDGSIYDRILVQVRKSIRVLVIKSPATTAKLNAGPENDGIRWYTRLYPRLNTLQWDDGIVSNPRAFHRLLDYNPNIQHLIFARNIRLVLNFLENYRIWLHRLDVTIRADDLPHIASIVDRLNQLFENGHFEHLFITCNRRAIFNYRFNGLKGIVFDGAYDPAIGQCTQLTHLKINSIGDNGLDTLLQLNALSSLYINRASLDEITQLICQAAQIKKIIIENIEIESLNEYDVYNLQNLAEHRSRLPNARRLKIYLEETSYCVFKRYTAGYSQWIEFCRIDELLNQN